MTLVVAASSRRQTGASAQAVAAQAVAAKGVSAKDAPCVNGERQDDPDYEAAGWACYQWTGYDCRGTGPYYGLTDAQVDELVTSCPVSCTDGDTACPMSSAPAPSLTPCQLARPCYLVDLLGEQASHTFPISLGGGLFVNNRQWDGEDYDLYRNSPSEAFPVGQVVSIPLSGADHHPFHIHVNPVQLQSETTGAGNYFLPGDWHDVLLLPEGNTRMDLKMQTDRFVGIMIMHCHILEHEDKGMMAMLELSGVEGTVWAGATRVDPTCRRSALADASALKATAVSSSSNHTLR